MPDDMERFEVAVVGGGITGVALGYWLARAGIRALVLERGELASGATGRNAGFLLAGVAANYAEAVALHGRARAREVWAFTRQNHDLLAAALDGAGGYLRRGSWVLAADAAEAEELRASEALLRADGIAASWVDQPELAGAHHGALLSPEDGELDSAAAVRALATLCPQGSVRPGVEVTGVEPTESGVLVATATGDIAAQQVVVATNAWAPGLLPGLPIAPVRGQMLATAPVGRVVADRPVYSQHGFRYWRQVGNGPLLLGGWRDTAMDTEVGYDDNPTPGIQARLDAHLGELGVKVPVVRRWAGTMGFTPDGLPLVGAAPGRPRTWLCAGYSGHGMGFAFLAARLLVARLGGGAALPAWMDPARFRPAAP